jgi:basic membrane protein A
MIMQKWIAACGTLILLASFAAACGSPTPEPTTIPTPVPTEPVLTGAGYVVCEVTDAQGVDDDSINSVVWAGIERAEKNLGIEARSLEVTSPSGYESGLTGLVSDGCDLIVAVGSDFDAAVEAVAASHPDQIFMLISQTAKLDLSNVLVQQFQVEDGAFVAGYAAAGVTSTGKIGVFGVDQDAQTVSIMNAFDRGIKHYNEVHSATTILLGWDPAAQQGYFTGSGSDSAVMAMASQLISESANVILPIASSAAIEPIRENGQSYGIGMVTDWSRLDPSYGNYVLTSILFQADDVVYEAISALSDGNFKGGTQVGNLANAGVDLAPVAIRAPSSSADVGSWIDALKQEVKALEESIRTGEVVTTR